MGGQLFEPVARAASNLSRELLLPGARTGWPPDFPLFFSFFFQRNNRSRQVSDSDVFNQQAFLSVSLDGKIPITTYIGKRVPRFYARLMEQKLASSPLPTHT